MRSPKNYGMSNTSEYKIWSSIIQRCTNPALKSSAHHGGRGITLRSTVDKAIQHMHKLGIVRETTGKQFNVRERVQG